MNPNIILDQNLDIDTDKPKMELISPAKFAILFVLSLGFYGFWWLYKTWRFFKEKDQSDLSPYGRSFFAIFYFWELLDRVLKFSKLSGYQKKYGAK